MLKLNINYNPYLIQTSFLINDKPLRSDSKLNGLINQKMQFWMKDILKILKEEKDFTKLDIKFKGREIDYQDLKNYYKENVNINIEHIRILESQERIEKLKKLFNKIQKGPYEELKNEKIKEYFEKTFSSEFEIGVIATMSSGKSTLLNAMIGEDLIPSKAQACTAKISKIYDKKNKVGYTGCIYSKDRKIKEINMLTNEDLKNLNDDKSIDLIEIYGNIKNIKSKETQLVLIDTPGPNNANDLKHKDLTFSLIKKEYKPLILYILNYQQLGITDDKRLLEYIGEEIKKTDDIQSSERFIFVLNRFDCIFENENDDPIDKTIENIKKYLKEIGIENPVIIPTSAFSSLLVRGGYNKENKKIKRLKENKMADLLEAYEDGELNINNYMNISPMIINKILKNLKESEDDEIKADYLTGVPALEEYINDYLEKYAIPEKIKKASDTFVNFIKKEELENKIFTDMRKSEKQLEDWKKNILNIEKKYKTEIPKIRKRLQNLITEIKNNLIDKIENYETKIEMVSNKIKRIEESGTTSKSNAMENVRKYIKELQEEYIKLKTDMESDLSISLNEEVKKLLKFYEIEITNISGETIDDEFTEMIKKVLTFDIKTKIDFNETYLEEILQKTRT